MATCRIRGLGYALGEHVSEHTAASGYREVLAREQIPEVPEMWGWGRFHTTDQPYVLGCRAGREALHRAELSPRDIDLLIVSCAYFPESDEELYRGAARMMRELEVVNAALDGLTLGGCATLLTSLQRAVQLVEAQVSKNVLVVAIDKLPTNELRFWNYALFSDAAAALVVSQDCSVPGYRVLATRRELNVAELGGDVRFNATSLLHVKVLDAMFAELEREGVTRRAIKKAFNNNVFLPIKSQKDKLAGLSREQRFTDNVVRIGHCLSCDSVINLVDYCGAHPPRAGDQFLMQGDGNGICAVALLEWTDSVTRGA